MQTKPYVPTVGAMQRPLFPVVQRWRERRASYRPAREVVDTRTLGVEPIDEARARAFVELHHYSGSYPAARCRAGLFQTRPLSSPELVGVAVFSVPMNEATTKKYLGLGIRAGVELGRFVLLDDVGANAETWFLSRAFRLLKLEKREVRGVVSFSDPVQRSSADGSVVMPGHLGSIYQAGNATYLGRGSRGSLVLAPDGRALSPRALSKLRCDGQGAAYAYRQLLAAGAPPRQLGEAGAAYVDRALKEGQFRRLRHPGNHVYAWSFDGVPPATAWPYPKNRPVIGGTA